MHPGDMLVIASDGLLDLLDDHAVVDDALQFLAGHTDPAQLCSAVAKLTETRLATDDITIVALRPGKDDGRYADDVCDSPNNSVAVHPRGRLNMATAPALREELTELLDSGRRAWSST